MTALAPLLVALHLAGAAAPYDRADFPHWIDADGDGCDARCEVLAEERSPGGSGWSCPYTGEIVTEPSGVHVDHVIPLKVAWEAGGWRWPVAIRTAYANWLADEAHLVAVTASANLSKGARGPSEWMPEEGRCEYVEWWSRIAAGWGLRLDEADREAIEEVRDGCQE